MSCRAISIWRNARSKKKGTHQPELTAVRTAVRSGEKTLILHLQKWRKNPLEPPQIRFFQERVKKSVHFWCIFWDTKRAASVCLSTTCGFLSAVRGEISVCLNRVLNVLYSIISFVTKIYRVSNVYIEIKRKFGPQIGPQFLSLHTKNG